jgi:predicted DNA-binding transcriptional regulator YafY
MRTPPALDVGNIAAMADPAARLLRLLSLLQRRATWSGATLAERLGVDPRTLRRDIERLRDLGYEVEASPGAGGGYRLSGGTDVPPLLLDDDEAMAIAVVLGVSAGAAVPGIEQGALAALAKLDRLLPRRLRSQVTALRSATVSLVTPTDVVPAEHLTHLAQACESHQRVTFSYRTPDGRLSDRRAEPHCLVATDRRWYLVAYDLDRQDWRTFRVDRASSVQVTGHTFEARDLADPARLVAEAITTTFYAHRAVVRVYAAPDDVARLIPTHVGIVQPDGDRAVVELGVDDFDWLAGYLVSRGLAFEVLAPSELRQHIAALGRRLAASHSPEPPAS